MTDHDRETLKDIKEEYPQIQRAWSLVLGAGGWAGEWRSVRFDSEQLYNWFLMWRTHIIWTDSESESHSTDIWCWLESTQLSATGPLAFFSPSPLLLSLSLSALLVYFSLSPCFDHPPTPILWIDTFSLCLYLSDFFGTSLKQTHFPHISSQTHFPHIIPPPHAIKVRLVCMIMSFDPIIH